jgi:hypothetical protein
MPRSRWLSRPESAPAPPDSSQHWGAASTPSPGLVLRPCAPRRRAQGGGKGSHILTTRRQHSGQQHGSPLRMAAGAAVAHGNPRVRRSIVPQPSRVGQHPQPPHSFDRAATSCVDRRLPISWVCPDRSPSGPRNLGLRTRSDPKRLTSTGGMRERPNRTVSRTFLKVVIEMF